MTDLNYYKPLTTINDSEENMLGKMQLAFNSAIGNYNTSQSTMVSSYMSANESKQKCYDECPQGWEKNSATWKQSIEADGGQTTSGSSGGLNDVVAACKAGCDLKWPGIIQNSTNTQGVDAGKTIGIYRGSDGTNQTITQCSDLSKYAPKVKLGGICDSNNECESKVCVTSGNKCAIGKDKNVKGRCGLGVTRVDGSTYSWGTTFNKLCKSDVEKIGLTKWSNVTQYFKYLGVWVKISNIGFPAAPNIENQRLVSGKYISDLGTAIKAGEAYGDYCKGFYQINGTTNFILQSVGGSNPKPSWTTFLGELTGLNDTHIESFTSSLLENKTLSSNPTAFTAWGKFDTATSGQNISAKDFEDPTFPIAAMNAAMKKTCPKGWKASGLSCEISNDDMKMQGTAGWQGTTISCNLPGQPKHYDTDCVDVPHKNFYCWNASGKIIPNGQSSCKQIKGIDIVNCLSSGGRAREVSCPVPATMILWIGRPSKRYFATKNDIVPVLQQIATEFPDVRLTDQSEMNNIIAKNIAYCAYGWHRTDVFNGKTWKTGNSSADGPGIEKLPLANEYPSNSSTNSGCGNGLHGMVSDGGLKGGIYLTLTGTQQFTQQKLEELGYSSGIVESHQQLIQKAPKRDVANNSTYLCSTGDSFATYNANTLTASQKSYASSAWPGKPPSFYACIQGCSGTCKISNHTGVMMEHFVGGMKEGFDPLENDMINQCKAAGTQNGVIVPGAGPVGNFLVENRKKEKTNLSKLQTIQKQVKNSINQMQSQNLNVNSLYKTKNTDLLKQLAKYELAGYKLLKTGANLNTLNAQNTDSILKKNSVDMSYYLWLALAISTLGFAITRINK